MKSLRPPAAKWGFDERGFCRVAASVGACHAGSGWYPGVLSDQRQGRQKEQHDQAMAKARHGFLPNRRDNRLPKPSTSYAYPNRMSTGLLSDVSPKAGENRSVELSLTIHEITGAT
jgi:hypothetical protein